jgi:subfamily B ATP-binding cassette protein MsbA
MKTYFRLLSFAKPIEKFAIPYIITTLLAVLFGVLNLTLLSPLFSVMMAEEQTITYSKRNRFQFESRCKVPGVC